MSRRRRKSIRTSRKGIVVIFALLVVGGLLVGLLPQFYIVQIRVSGQRVITNYEVIKCAGITKGVHIFNGVGGTVSEIFSLRHPDKERMIIQSLPYVKSVTVRSEFPSVLSVSLEERIEVAYISIQDGYLIIDADGVALEVLGRSEVPDVPVIEGLIVRNIDLGSVASVDKQDYLNQTAVILNSVFKADLDARSDIELLSAIASIRPVGSGIAYVRINLPDRAGILNVKVKAHDGIGEDMAWLRFALDQHKLDGLGEGVLDLSTSQRVFVPEQ
ncbi:MAG: FtsQ-type POTRA domain-containing protein [Eubacteriales bacterium]|nr:FtsQ-type POTRA domain-containing protein [Eubacteriales bacterium]MDD4326612.1 FtsQ-type POTRA domain-containing protein [Eubacteriales bacterium]MDD4716542.1 FtsQ-type POTRA domain-containing protein [Eubacteriales bacterium]